MDALINAVESTENTVDQSHFYEEEENDVIEVCNTVDVDDTPNETQTTTQEPTSPNGILIELQNTMSVPSYENANVKSMKMDGGSCSSFLSDELYFNCAM